MKNRIAKWTCAITLLASFSGNTYADLFEEATFAGQGGIGYRQDSIVWKMKTPESIKNSSSSHLHFKDLEIVLIGAKFQGLISGLCYTRASFDYGWILDGSLREELTLRAQQKFEHFHKNGHLKEGRFNRAVARNDEKGKSYVWDFDLAFGTPFYCGCEGFQVAPTVGFAYDRLQLHIRNKERIFSKTDSPFPQIYCGKEIHDRTNSSSKYRFSWWSPWVGFDVFYAADCWSLFGEFELRFGRVERMRSSSIGNENFDHYKRTKWFWGTITRLGANYTFCDNWYLEASVSYSQSSSQEQHDSLSFSSATTRVDTGFYF